MTYEEAIACQQLIDDVEQRFRDAMSVESRKDYDRYRTEERELLSAFTRGMTANNAGEVAMYAAAVSANI